MLDSIISQQIKDAWEKDQNNPRRDREKKIELDISVLKTLVEIAFQASMAKEEEQSLLFSLVMYSREEYDGQLLHGCRSNALIFEKKQPLSEEKIRKLTPALHPGYSGLAVEISGENDLTIWGMVYWGAQRNRFNEIPAGIEGFMTSRPDALTVTVTGVGNLLISRGHSKIGILTRGVFEPASPTPLVSNSLGGYLMEMIKGGELYNKFNTKYWYYYRDSVMYLIQRISLRSHGASVVMIQEDSIEDMKDKFEDKYKLSGNLHIDDALNKMMQKEAQVHDILRDEPESAINLLLIKVKIGQQYLERLNMLAQLACVDGALIISSKLEIITFAAKLTANKWTGNVLRWHDETTFDISTFGTRHSSMINFIGACDSNSIGLVFSQDGPIRGIVKRDSDNIIIWPDCRTSMFVD